MCTFHVSEWKEYNYARSSTAVSSSGFFMRCSVETVIIAETKEEDNSYIICVVGFDYSFNSVKSSYVVMREHKNMKSISL